MDSNIAVSVYIPYESKLDIHVLVIDQTEMGENKKDYDDDVVLVDRKKNMNFECIIIASNMKNRFVRVDVYCRESSTDKKSIISIFHSYVHILITTVYACIYIYILM